MNKYLELQKHLLINQKTWLITGVAGFIGSNLLEKLLILNQKVIGLDNFDTGYQENIDQAINDANKAAGKELTNNFQFINGDIRDLTNCEIACDGVDFVLHHAALGSVPRSINDPLSSHIANVNGFLNILVAAKEVGIKRVVYASSSSVYGIKDEPEVTEDLSLEPLTDYSKFKALCEEVLEEERQPGFVTCTIRPSTVCGYAPRQRLDVIVNILTNHAVNNGRIRVFGGSQKRPNIHIDDMADLYVFLLDQPDGNIDGKIFNAGYENHTVMQLAEMVKAAVGGDLAIDIEPTNDLRSYHVSSEKMRRELGFEPTHSIEDAVTGLVDAFKDGRLPNSMDDPKYFNINLMKQTDMK